MKRTVAVRPLVSAALVGVTLALSACGSSATMADPSTASGAADAAPSAPPSSTGGVQAPQTPVAAESNPPGDIPDNLAFVSYTNDAGRYSFTHPEGWAQTGSGTAVLFTDKLNGVTVDVGSATTAPTVDTAGQQDVPMLQATQPAFELRDVSAVSGDYGSGVRIVYRRNSEPDPVTGRQYRDEVERYEIVSGGREIVMELFGPVGADNVDAYRTMISSLVVS